MTKLRPYQEKAVEKMLWSLSLEGNDIVCVAQGGGKTHIIAEFVKRYGEAVLILTPSKELLEQDYNKLKELVPVEDIGIFSASFNSKEIRKFTLATIQSAYKTPEKFSHYKVVIIDECDLLVVKNLDSMYRSFFYEIGSPKVIGMTGTPYRQDVIYERWGRQKWQVKTITTLKMINRYKARFWDRMLYVVNTQDLMDKYLTPLEYKDVSVITHDQIPTNKTQSEFDLEAFEQIVSNDYTSISEFIEKSPHNKKLVFCSSVQQAEKLQTMIKGSTVITAKTPMKRREKGVEAFRKSDKGVLLGVGIFSVGFDVPDIDSLFILRPTKSLRLWSQVIGRGTRLHEGKTKCTVYDFVDNTRNLGTLESIKVVKIDNKWNVVSSARPNGFHYEKLFEYKLKDPSKKRWQEQPLETNWV